MKYYGIKTPKKRNEESFIFCIGSDEYACWERFLTYKPHKLSLHEAKTAYKAIGYSCVELEIKEK